MNAKIKVGIVAATSAGIALVIIFQRLELARVSREAGELRQQATQIDSLQAENDRLTQQLNDARAAAGTNESQLARFRGQAVRLRQLEQENAQLKLKGQDLQNQLSSARSAAAMSDSVPQTPSAGANPSPPPTTDLGVLELTDNVGRQFDLGGGTNCVVTPAALADGNIAMRLVMAANNSDGTPAILGQSRLEARPGQYCWISVADRIIRLAVTVKKPQ
jgi:TolA-binding protein